jgi:hypothetical protein
VRVLSFAVVSVAAIAGTSTVACYDPSIADCKFTCGVDSSCPAGFTCATGNVCRDSTTGSCGSNEDIDAPMCPAAPAGCGSGMLVLALGSNVCFTSCDTPEQFGDAMGSCTPPWHLATLDTSAKLLAVPLQNEPFWVGARRSTPAQPFEWLQTSADVTNNLGTITETDGNCLLVNGAVSPRVFTANACTIVTNRFVCDTQM